MSTGYADIASTIDQLKSLNTAILEDKVTIFVKELSSWVTYDSSSNLASDNTTVFSPSSGVGRWKVTNIISTSNLFKSFQASENISALRAVTYATGELIRYSDYLTQPSVIGISANAATTSNSVKVYVAGLLSDNSWNWIINRQVFLGANGILTQTPPISGYLVSVGTAVSTKAFNIVINNPILLTP